MPTNRRNFLIQSSLATAAVITAKTSGAVSKTNTWMSNEIAKDNSITILHTNDILSKLYPESGHSPYAGMGGYTHTCKHIAHLKKSHKQVLLLDAGNSYNGNFKALDDHHKTLQLMQRMQYDAVMPGVRDMRQGTDKLIQDLKNHNLPAVATSINLNDRELQELVAPFKIIKKGNIKIGIVGASRNVSDIRTGVSIKSIDPVKNISRTASWLKENKGCQLVICLSQLGYKNSGAVDDLSLARLSEGVDVIVGGYSCTFMKQPTIMLNKNNEEVVINHAGRSGILLGNINISFDDNGNKRSILFNNSFIKA